MEDLRKWYRAGLATRMEALKAARRGLSHDPGAPDSVRRLAHTLRGSGTTYGFPEVTEAAASLEDAAPADIDACLERLLEVMARIGSVPGADDKAGILVIDDDPLITDLLQT